MHRYLVIGHRTLGGAHLFDRLQELRSEDPTCRFHVVVPQYHPRELMWSDGTTQTIAQQRLDEMLAAMTEAGMEATGEVGNANPVSAISDALEREGSDAFSGIILSTLPRGISSWLSADVPRRVEKQFPLLPLTHLIADETAAG
ncbi:MAG: hypothetical protein GY720_08650 [bacterium]|nr:hypothetical protein [bacterium]